ncbi:hypothetical protein [Paraburkholderia sp. J41]|uniref:hypothetical protein n=1 Tax=Paraburkholderia sp. J41 TaxID=2805433 RepID=UPI002AC353F1|nr:hypothetical protein [Paraburkholderia sp. J41]
MRPHEKDVIAHLRSRGYAVVVWTPDELRGASARVIEDIGIERMSEAIGMLATEPRDEDLG